MWRDWLGWTKADNTTITYDYNPLGQMTQLSAPDQIIAYFYDAAGRRTGMTDLNGDTTYELDELGRPVTITLSTGEAVSYRYDNVGNRTEIIYPDNKTVTYSYNALNQVETVTDWDSGVTTYDYDVMGRPITVTLPNDTVSSLAYDAAGNVTEIVHKDDIGNLIGSYRYQYDGTGRRIGSIENGTTITYTYDALYRLTDVVNSVNDVYTYVYDAAGNRVLKQEPGALDTYTYDAANQLTAISGISTTLDANGNLLLDGQRAYTYDDLDRLIQVTQGMTTTLYGYTGDGDRLWQHTAGVTTTFTLDLNGALAQVLAQKQGGQQTTFLPGIGQYGSGGWSYFHTDALGSVRHLSGGMGGSLGDIDYSPFGEIVNSTGMASWFGFTGEQQDGSSGLTYLRARYYDPSLGRFLTPDNIIPDITNGQSLNAYAYVYNDPINLVDPSGHVPALPIEGLGLPTQEDARSALRTPFEAGLNFIDWWYSEPENCNCQSSPQWLNNGYDWLANQGFQYLWSEIISVAVGAPAQYVMRPFSTLVVNDVALETFHFVRKPVSVTLLPSAITSVFGAGVIDAIFQLLSDTFVNNRCLSPNQIFWRLIPAIIFGILAGLAGLVGGVAMTGILAALGFTTATVFFTVGGLAITGATVVAVAAFAASLAASIKLYDTKQGVIDGVTDEAGQYGQ